MMPQRKLWINTIDISATYLSSPNVSSIFKIRNDFMSGTLRHADKIGDFPSSTSRIMRYIAEDQTMIRDEGPSTKGLRLLQSEGSKLEISFNKGSESITVEQKSQQPLYRFSLAISLATSIKDHFGV